MSFTQAIGVCFRKYVDFSGRAGRPEYWWFFLFTFIVSVVTGFIPFVGGLVSLALLLPSLAVTARRLHDTNRSGWWVLLPFGLAFAGAVGFAVGAGALLMSLGWLVGFIALLVFLVRAGDAGDNRYGPPPGGPAAAPAMGGSPPYGGDGAYCVHCGAGIQPGASFCTACGSVL